MENEILDSEVPGSVDEIVIVETDNTEMPAEVISAAPKKTIAIPTWLNRKNGIIALIVVLVLAAAWYYKGLVIAATVNGQPISRLSVIKEVEKASGKTTLDAMISEKLITMEAAKRGITVTDAEVAAEFTKLEKQLTDQGQNLDTVLASQNLTRDDITKRIIIQKKLEKMLADKLSVTDAEVDAYIKTNKVTLPKGKEADTKAQIKDQIKSDKLNTEAGTFVTQLHTNAKINYYVNY